MLISRDPNTLSAPNCLKKKDQGNDLFLQDPTSRKSILKKHMETKKEMNKEVENIRKSIRDFNKENHKYGVSIVFDRNSSGSEKENSIIKEKKKSSFLDSLESSQNSKSRKRSRVASNLSTGSDQNSSKNYHGGYKQSKIDIMFSNSNISDDIWDLADENVIDEVSEKHESTKNKLQSSDVVEISVPEYNSNESIPKVNFKIVNKYSMQNSDRIMEDSNEKDEDTKTSKIFTDKQTEATSNPSPYKSIITPPNIFRKSSYYEGFEEEENDSQEEFFTIIQSPPVEEASSESSKPKSKRIIENENGNKGCSLNNSKSEVNLSNHGKNSIYREKIEQFRRRVKEALGESVYQYPEQLGFTMRKTESNVISKSVFMSRIDKILEFREQMFEKINIYRFLNRLEYKIRKFFTFKSNQEILETIVEQIIRKKCYILLNAEIELESLTKSQRKYDEKDKELFLQIIQAYVEKESQKPYWKDVEEEFEKVSFLCFSLKDTSIEFLLKTIPEVQQSIQSIRGKLDRGEVTYETLLFQLRVKIMKYLYYDLHKLNLTEHSHPSNIRETPFNKQRRLKKIIEEDEWYEKIPFKELLQQFYFLKQDIEQVYHEQD